MRIEELVYGSKGNETYLTLVLRKCDVADTYKLETRRGIYLIYGHDNEVLYIGESTSVKRRIKEHLTPNKGYVELNRKTVAYVEYAYVSADKYERAIMEGLLVNKYKPALNCDDDATKSSMTRMPQQLLNDILFYIKNTNYTDRVISNCLGSYFEQVRGVRNSGVPARTTLPTGFVPSVIITEEMAEEAMKPTEITKELFFEIKGELAAGKETQAELAMKHKVSSLIVSEMKNLKQKRYKAWEKERLELAA